MGQLVLGLAGAAVGGAFGMPGLGWSIGAAIGGALFAPTTKTEGPRLGDNRVTSSTLGTPMTVLYGTARLNGNIIQASKIREVSKTETQGKGGPSAESTTYTYNVDLAVDLCAGECLAVSKLWFDSKLAYDMSGGATNEALIASSVKAAGFKFYSGSETQLPDPTLEALLGVGMVPAYRGRSYVVFSQLDCPGGRIPQISFEVIGSGTVSQYVPTATVAAGPTPQGIAVDASGSFVYVGNYGASTVRVFDAATLDQVSSFASDNFVESIVPSHDGSKTFVVSAGTKGVEAFSFPNNIAINHSSESGFLGFAINGSDTLGYASKNASIIIIDLNSMATLGSIAVGGSARKSALTPDETRLYVPLFDTGKVDVVDFLAGVVVASIAVGGAPVAVAINKAGTLAYVATGGGNTIAVIDIETNTVIRSIATPSSPGDIVLSEDDAYAYIPQIGFSVVDLAAGTVIATAATGLGTSRIALHPSGTFAYTSNNGGSSITAIQLARTIDQTPPTLEYIILSECERAGLSVDKVDASGLDDEVPGYPITRVSTARANIEPLLMGYFIDPVEVDGLLRFIKRSAQAVTPLVAYSELAATSEGSDSGDPFPLTRGQEDEFPRSITVAYMNVASDYQNGAEIARRVVTRSINDISKEMPFCTTSDHAARVAQVLLFDSWNGRNKRSAKISRRFAYLTTGCIIPVEYPRGTIQNRVITRAVDTGVLMEIDAIDANAEIYEVDPPGSTSSAGQVVAPTPPPSQLVVGDWPILRDVDDNAGVYVAMSGIAPGWRGAALYMGIDDASLQFEGSVDLPAPIGAAETALGAFGPRFIDEINTVVLSMGPNALTNSTREAVLTSGANAIALGAPGRWEILQFIRAEALGGGRYRISGLNRGQRGTEANRSNHEAGDTVVLLVPLGMLRPGFDLSELNQPRRFKAVTRGRRFDSTASVGGVNTGVGLKPFSPYRLRKSVAAGDITLSWSRRTRLSENWLLGLEPLGEASEAYQVDIYNGSAVVRTISSTAPAALYTSAQQIADFGSLQASVSVRVYQISASIGRGFPLTGVI